MKFIHTADWQIGRIYAFEADGDGHDPAAALAKARYDVVARIAALATAEQVDAVLVAGDVFDKQALSDSSLRRVIHAMSGFSGRWVLLPGNHDAALAESVWTRLQRLGVLTQNMHVALRPEVMDFADAGFVVLPAPLTQRQTHADASEWFDGASTAPGLARIGLAHGSVAGILPESAPPARSWIIWRWAIGMAPSRSMRGPGTAARPNRIASRTMIPATCCWSRLMHQVRCHAWCQSASDATAGRRAASRSMAAPMWSGCKRNCANLVMPMSCVSISRAWRISP